MSLAPGRTDRNTHVLSMQHTCVMPARTVNLNEEAYEILASLKKERESFSDVVKRVAGERSLFDLVGVLDPEQSKKLDDRIRAGRDRAARRRGRQLR